MKVRLPSDFTDVHRAMARRFVQGDSLSGDDWPSLYETFDLLHLASVATEAGWERFDTIYERLIESSSLTHDYLRCLMEVQDVEKSAEPLRAQVSREIGSKLKVAGLVDPAEPYSFYLLAYCLYWWYAFAKGYAFELEVLRDLHISGIYYQAHNVLDPQARRSPFDLVVMGFQGDIKTSTYFLQTARTQSLAHDFYITRIRGRKRIRTLVVFMRAAMWQKIDGETLFVLLSEIADTLPQAARIVHEGVELTVIDYAMWKEKVRSHQTGRKETEK